MGIDHWLIEEFGQVKFNKVLDIISRRKLAKSFSNLRSGPDEDVLLKELLETFEFAAIDLWNSDDPQKKKTFIDICSCYLDICQVIELPVGDMEKIRFAIKLIAFGYLGERWESVRRYLIDKESQFLEVSDTDEWNLRLFRNIYFAIFHIVRKHQWQDLQKSIEMIRKLREEQALFEENFLNGVEIESKKGYALELVALYHLAKCVELVGEYQVKGHPNDVIEQLKFHFDYAIQYTELGGNVELNLILRFLHPTFEKMVYNSLWMIGRSVNSRVTKFIDSITKANKPIIELMYPQRHAILEGGLLDLAKQAIVVNMPTSSGKTLIAEFRILLALNQFADEKGWVAYVAPTRTLVNQVTSRLRRDLSAAPLNLRVEAVSGALEVDAYEDALLSGGQDNFDIDRKSVV